MDEIEIPQYFICPISLQIMKDPVTATTGITYDRESIECWLSTAEDATCPVTKQPLPKGSDLTPNHTLRRLIQAWCIANAKYGIDQIPTPKSPLTKSHVLKLFRDLKVPQLYMKTLKTMDLLANEDENNRKCMVEVGTAKKMVLLIIRCFKEGRTQGLEESLRILHLIWRPLAENNNIVKENLDFVESIMWGLRCEVDNHVEIKTHAMLVLNMVIEFVSSSLLEGLKLEFFKQMMNVMRERVSQQATKAALHVLIVVCPWGRNRMKIVETGAVFELVELELNNSEKNITEPLFCLLAHLCSCTDGREQLLKHAGGVAIVSKRILRVSQATDDQALQILALIAKFSATNQVLKEMLRVGAVTKLCMVLQADCAAYLKNKANEILKWHNHVWHNSPCIAIYLLTRYAR